jgi:hypothetical protein
MNTPAWSNTADALALLARQRTAWPLAGAGYDALEKVKVKLLHIDGLKFKVQYNPARIISSAAKAGAQPVRERPCFLCPSRLPAQQEALPMGGNYLLLCNPYPIFPEHFTIASQQHVAQRIYPHFADFLAIARSLSGLTLFYNGPRSGASAPDHLHFQAVTPMYMPIDEEAALRRKILRKEAAGTIYLLSGYIRNGFILESGTEEGAASLFTYIYNILPHQADDGGEPRMNLFCRYGNRRWQIIVIPRIAHRPRQYYAEGDEHVLASPGAADMGGVFITPLEKDFDKMTPPLLRDIYTQTAYGDDGINSLVSKYFPAI